MIGFALWALSACGDLTQQDTWEILGVNQDLAVIDARLETSNTGFLKGQGRIRFDWIFRDQTPVYHGRDGLPGEILSPESGGLMVGPDGLSLGEDGTWSLEVRDEETRAMVSLRPSLGGPAPMTWEDDHGDWTVEFPVVLGELGGFVTSGPRSALVKGHGVLTHRHGDAPPAFAGTQRLAVYILGEDTTLGVDLTGPRAVSWAIIGDYAFDARDARLNKGKRGRLVLDLRPTADLVAHVLPRRPRSVRRPWEHLHLLERWLLKGWHGNPVRRTQGGRVNLLIGGESLEARAVIVEVTWE